MRVRWTPAAADDLQHIFDYLVEHDPPLAHLTVISIHTKTKRGSLRRPVMTKCQVPNAKCS